VDFSGPVPQTGRGPKTTRLGTCTVEACRGASPRASNAARGLGIPLGGANPAVVVIGRCGREPSTPGMPCPWRADGEELLLGHEVVLAHLRLSPVVRKHGNDIARFVVGRLHKGCWIHHSDYRLVSTRGRFERSNFPDSPCIDLDQCQYTRLKYRSGLPGALARFDVRPCTR